MLDAARPIAKVTYFPAAAALGLVSSRSWSAIMPPPVTITISRSILALTLRPVTRLDLKSIYDSCPPNQGLSVDLQ